MNKSKLAEVGDIGLGIFRWLVIGIASIIGLAVFAFLAYIGYQVYQAYNLPLAVRADFVGRFTGQFGGGTEVIVFHDNGTYSQMFTVGKTVVYKNSGTWEFSGHKLSYHHFVWPPDYLVPGSKKPIVYSDFDDDLESFDGSLTYSEDLNIGVERDPK